MKNVHRAIVLAGLTAVSCVKTAELDCVVGHALCGGVCVEVRVDRQNCGACGNTCATDETCAAGACVPDCRLSLHAPVTDAWGYAWDGLERPAATFPTARAACETIAGRLPSVSELARVSAGETAEVGDAYAVNPLWSLTPSSATAGNAVKLSDGTVSLPAQSTPTNYRCVCPPERPAAFSEGACYGPAGHGCASQGGDPRFNFDAEDRPPMTKAGAIAECALAGGELPSAERLAAAVARGLPNGSGAALHTGDDTGHYHADAYYVCVAYWPPIWCSITGQCGCMAGYTVPAVDEQYDALVSFSGTDPAFSEANVTVQRPFRCSGPAAPGAVAASVAHGFLEPRGERTIDADPDAVATTFSAAVSDCFRKGGHLPSATELAAFAAQGLPAGANAGARWTSDGGEGAYAVTFAWAGSAYWPIDPDLASTTPTTQGVPYVLGATSVSRLPRSDAAGLPYRCVYYAVDPTFPRPADAGCSGANCFEVSPGAGTSPARPRMWFDWSNRGGGGSDTFKSAVASCAAVGARLPSARDYVEAIRSGLTNSGDTVLTSDLVLGSAARTITGWNGSINPGFPDTGSSTVALAATNVKYRCMWTNENPLISRGRAPAAGSPRRARPGAGSDAPAGRRRRMARCARFTR